ncbi:hypothetical protein FHG87_012389 [Trinorchestia longiramus]|nr:hypothetical protein FHG87_012389 [Trinorchestia longiramus]
MMIVLRRGGRIWSTDGRRRQHQPVEEVEAEEWKETNMEVEEEERSKNYLSEKSWMQQRSKVEGEVAVAEGASGRWSRKVEVEEVEVEVVSRKRWSLE